MGLILFAMCLYFLSLLMEHARSGLFCNGAMKMQLWNDWAHHHIPLSCPPAGLTIPLHAHAHMHAHTHSPCCCAVHNNQPRYFSPKLFLIFFKKKICLFSIYLKFLAAVMASLCYRVARPCWATGKRIWRLGHGDTHGVDGITVSLLEKTRKWCIVALGIARNSMVKP